MSLCNASTIYCLYVMYIMSSKVFMYVSMQCLYIVCIKLYIKCLHTMSMYSVCIYTTSICNTYVQRLHAMSIYNI